MTKATASTRKKDNQAKDPMFCHQEAALKKNIDLLLRQATAHYDDLSPLLHQLALDLSLINGDTRGAQQFLKVVEKRKIEAGLYRPGGPQGLDPLG